MRTNVRFVRVGTESKPRLRPDPEMNPDKQNFLQDLQTRLNELIRTSPAGDVERNLKAVLGQAFQRLELVTREEFDDYAALLASLRARISQLEESVARLEGSPTAPAAGSERATPVSGP